MTDRIRLGVKGSSKGLWVSKPGYSVSSANAGDMLFASDAQVYQVIMSGTQIVDSWTGGSGYESTLTISTPLGIGNYSNVALWFDAAVSILYNTTSLSNDYYVRAIRERLDQRARITSGVVISTVTVYYYKSTDLQPRISIPWFAFRSQYA